MSGRSVWQLFVAVVVGLLILPVTLDQHAARAAWHSLAELHPGGKLAADPERQPRVGTDGMRVQDQKHPKMDGRTALVARSAKGHGGRNPLDVARSQDVVVVHDALVRVVIESAAAPAAARAAVRAAGGILEADYHDLVQASVAPVMLEALANDPAVKYLRQPARPQPDAVAGQGVGASGAWPWQVAGFTGQGVKVGVIDVGFTGYQARQTAGDLPTNLTVVDFCNGQLAPTGGQHGTAVAEIVYEMAPGVDLFLLCIGTEVQLGQAKDYAKANGISILVMSLSWLNTGRGDGSGTASSPNGIVSDARANGILWINSAGNYARKHFGAAFHDLDGDGFHNFEDGPNSIPITMVYGTSFCVYLRWDNWPVTNQDFDIYLAFRDTGVIVAGSAGDQSGTQPPTEALCYANTSNTVQLLALYVDKYDATTNPHFDLFFVSDFNPMFITEAGSITEPASSPYAMAVGAICWGTSRYEEYSGRGPTIDGRMKPDIAGQSVVASGSYWPYSECPGGSNGTWGFGGTSAAAPHVGGAAALVKGANPGFTAAQIQAFLEARAADLGVAGRDNLFGAGRLTLGAVPLGPVACTPRPPISVRGAIGGGRQIVTVTVSGTNNLLLALDFGGASGALLNAMLDLPDGRTGVTGAPGWSAPSALTQTTFSVRRQVSGGWVRVPFTVTDRCGPWRTFIGAGPGEQGL